MEAREPKRLKLKDVSLDRAKLLGWGVDPDWADQEINDDEAERQERRDQADFKRKLARTLSAQKDSSLMDTDEDTESSETQMSESMDEDSKISEGEMSFEKMTKHFKYCQKLFAKNKINSDNVWNLNVLDYLSAYIRQSDNIEEILEVAGAALEIGAKIYDVKVDDVYTDTLKSAMTVGDIYSKEDESETESNDGEENDASEQTEKPAKKRSDRFLDTNHSYILPEDIEHIAALRKIFDRVKEERRSERKKERLVKSQAKKFKPSTEEEQKGTEFDEDIYAAGTSGMQTMKKVSESNKGE